MAQSHYTNITDRTHADAGKLQMLLERVLGLRNTLKDLAYEAVRKCHATHRIGTRKSLGEIGTRYFVEARGG